MKRKREFFHFLALLFLKWHFKGNTLYQKRKQQKKLISVFEKKKHLKQANTKKECFLLFNRKIKVFAQFLMNFYKNRVFIWLERVLSPKSEKREFFHFTFWHRRRPHSINFFLKIFESFGFFLNQNSGGGGLVPSVKHVKMMCTLQELNLRPST